MRPRDLETLRFKVESGEPLSPDELERLRDAAQAQPGPTLRLAVAHALINDGDERGALPLLERLVRDFPRDLQSWLGLARAQWGLDRREDAERSLKQALTLSPEDAEALKVLAVIALQRGELARARHWVEDVLRSDPFDHEARLIQAELEAAGEGAPPPAPDAGRHIALRPELTRAMLEALRRRGVRAAKRDGALYIQPEGGNVARVDLRSLYDGYLAQGRPLEEAVELLVDGLLVAAGEVPRGSEAILDRVLPVLRPRSFEEQAPGAAHTEGPAGLLVYYALEDPRMVRYVPRGALESRGLKVEEMKAAAFARLERAPAPVRPVEVKSGQLQLAGPGARLYAVCAQDGHDPARLLTRAQREVLEEAAGPGPWRVNLGLREVAVVCRAKDAEAFRELATLRGAPDGIGGLFELAPDGALSPCEVSPPPR